MKFTESLRAEFLSNKFASKNISLQTLLSEDYKAIAIHSNSTIFTLNEAAADLFGYDVIELIGLNAWTLFPPSSAPKLAENILKHSKEPYQVTAFRKDGSLFELIIKGIDFQLDDEPVRAILLKAADHD